MEDVFVFTDMDQTWQFLSQIISSRIMFYYSQLSQLTRKVEILRKWRNFGKKLLNQQYSRWTGVLGTLWISSTHLVHTGTVGISLYTSWGWYVSNWTQVTHITSFLIGYPLCGTLCSVTLIGFAVRTMRPLVSILPPSLLTTSTKRWKLTFTREYWVGEWALWKLLSLKSYLLDLYQTS